MSKVRLFINKNLETNQAATLDEDQSHYLANVMRMKESDEILCFNGRDGEFECKIVRIHKKHTEIFIKEKTKDFYNVPDLWLLFAPVKKDNTDFIIQKSTELGISKIVPIITKYTNSEKVRIERFQNQAIEASEQCQRLDTPSIENAIKFEKAFENWDNDRILYFMDETKNGENIVEVFSKAKTPAAILVGPEGGFAKEELDFLRSQKFAKAVSLGKRILRAETAVVSAISCFQALAGDWK